ncbi:MAG: hypothetical protein LUG12_05440 [Erysipelotrichaceae bacterium]|nr:hypothetical protein [Erysipelotrichaceae bacterium]
MIKKYTKRPVTIEAIQWLGNNTSEILDFCGSCCKIRDNDLIIQTLEGDHLVRVSDFIIKGIAGEFYNCNPEIFHKTYVESL